MVNADSKLYFYNFIDRIRKDLKEFEISGAIPIRIWINEYTYKVFGTVHNAMLNGSNDTAEVKTVFGIDIEVNESVQDYDYRYVFKE